MSVIPDSRQRELSGIQFQTNVKRDPRVRGDDVLREYRVHCASLMFAAFTTFAHFSTSRLSTLPK